MIELVKFENGNVVTTSLLVAEKFGKEHKHVLESIRSLTAENSAHLFFIESTYISTQNKELPLYIMNRDGFSLLVMGFTGSEALKFKIDFINAFNEMESKLRFQLPDFTNPAIAARAWADECEAKMLAQAKVKELEPQAEIAKAIVDSRKEYRMSEVAKIMEVLDDDNKIVGRNKFFAALRRAKILMDSNEPYQKYVDLGYFIYKTNVINEYVVNTCFVTGKGLAWLQHNRHKIFN